MTLSFLILASAAFVAFAIVGMCTAFAFSPALAVVGVLLIVGGIVSIGIDYWQDAAQLRKAAGEAR